MHQYQYKSHDKKAKSFNVVDVGGQRTEVRIYLFVFVSKCFICVFCGLVISLLCLSVGLSFVVVFFCSFLDTSEQRKKWLQWMDNVEGLLYVASLVDYNTGTDFVLFCFAF